MNLFRAFQADIAEIIADLTKSGDLPEGLDTANITVEPPRDPSHGDISTNAAMVLAKPAGMKPRDIATLIAPGIEALDGEIGKLEEALADGDLYTKNPARFAQLTAALDKARAEKDAAEERWLELAEMVEG